MLAKIEDLGNAGLELQKAHSNAIVNANELTARIEKAKAYIEKKGGIDSEEIDARVQKLISDCQAQSSAINAQRMPYTRFIQDIVVGAFTKIEKDLKDGPGIKFLTEERNKRARKLIEERKAREEEIAKKHRIASQKAQLATDAALFIGESVHDQAIAIMSNVREIWGRQRPETIDGFMSVVEMQKKYLAREDYDNIKLGFNLSRYADILDEASQILSEVSEKMYEKSSITFTQMLKSAFAAYTPESIAERKNELIRALTSNEPVKEEGKVFDIPNTPSRLERVSEICEDISVMANAQMANDLFSAITDIQAEPIVSVKTKKVIEITGASAIPVIFAFWYQREGGNLSVEELSKKTIKQMISFVEKQANSTGEIIEHKCIVYKDDIRAK